MKLSESQFSGIVERMKLGDDYVIGLLAFIFASGAECKGLILTAEQCAKLDAVLIPNESKEEQS